MTQNEVRYINDKKFVDEFNEYRSKEQAKGIKESRIKEAFAKRKKVCVLTIYRRIKFVEDYERRNGNNITA